MYLSRITLDMMRRTTGIALADRSYLHRAIERCFEGARQRPVWEVDRDGQNRHLVILSKDKGDLSKLVEMYGKNNEEPDVIEYEKYISKIENGSVVRFHATVAPISQCNGKEIPLNLKATKNHPVGAKDWFKNKMKDAGADVDRLYPRETERTRFSHGEKSIPLTLMTFEGFAHVEDRDKFITMLLSGTGRKRAYGAGLVMAYPV